MWFKVQLLLCFASLRSVVPEKIAEKKSIEEEWAAHDEREHKGPSTYEFGFDLEDRKSLNIQHRKEERLPNGTVTGSYGLLDPDGSVRMVHYVADALGYRAFVEKSNNSELVDSMPDKDLIAEKLEPMKHLTNDDLIHVSKSPLLVSAINSMKQFAASSIHEVRERPSANHYYAKNASDLYIFIPDKILVRREVEGKKGEFVTEEIDTTFAMPEARLVEKRSINLNAENKLALAKVRLPSHSPLNKKSVMFLLNQNDPTFRSQKSVYKRELTGQNGQFLTVQQQGNNAPPQTLTYNNHENAPPQEGFYEKIAPKIQDFTQNLAQQWANYATNQQPLQPIVNSLPQSSGTPYVLNVPPNYEKQTYRYPLNDAPPGEYAAPMNQQYNAASPMNAQYNVAPPITAQYNTVTPVTAQYNVAPPVNGQYVGPPGNQAYNGIPIQNYNLIPPNQGYAANPVNIEINGAPAGPELPFNPSPVNQYGGPPPDVGPDEDYNSGNPQQGGIVLPPGYGQYNGPAINANPAVPEASPFNIPPTVPSSYTPPVNIQQQNPYPDPSNPIIPPAASPAPPPDAPPLQYNNLNGPIEEHLNRLNAPSVSQLNVQQFNTPYGINPYVKVVPEEVDPNAYNLFNRPIGRQVGPSSPRPLPTDPEYYTNYYGDPYDPLDTNALKKNRIYVEPDVNRHNAYSNALRPTPYDIVQTGTNRYLPSPSNSLPYSTSSPDGATDSGEEPSSPSPSLASSPPPPSLPPPTPTSTPSQPKTRIIYYDEKIKD